MLLKKVNKGFFQPIPLQALDSFPSFRQLWRDRNRPMHLVLLITVKETLILCNLLIFLEKLRVSEIKLRARMKQQVFR